MASSRTDRRNIRAASNSVLLQHRGSHIRHANGLETSSLVAAILGSVRISDSRAGEAQLALALAPPFLVGVWSYARICAQIFPSSHSREEDE